MTIRDIIEEELLIEELLIGEMLVERNKHYKGINPDERYSLTKQGKDFLKKKDSHKFSDYKETSKQYKPGRERLISALINRVEHKGGNLSVAQARKIINDKYYQWVEKKLKWINRAEGKAQGLGFNPRKYKDQKPGDSAGKQPAEYAGRAYYFVTFLNSVANQELKKQGIKNLYQPGEKFHK